MKFVKYIFVCALFVCVGVGSVDAATPFAKVGTATTAGRRQQEQRQEKQIEEIPGTIERWVDGDTCVLVSDFGEEIRVRLWLVDAPESDQPGGALATEYVRNHKQVGTGKRVILGSVGTDKYKRTLGQLKGNGEGDEYTTEEFLASGYFWPYYPALQQDIPREQERRLEKIFDDTVAAQKGIFKYGKNNPLSAVQPYLWRKKSKEEKDSLRAEFERQAFGLESKRSH